MPKLTVNNQTIDVEQGKRLVLAIEATGLNIGHRCGGHARCTTCRVENSAVARYVCNPVQPTQGLTSQLRLRRLLQRIGLVKEDAPRRTRRQRPNVRVDTVGRAADCSTQRIQAQPEIGRA